MTRLGQVIRLRPAASSGELTDESLVAGCALGDRAARALLFERFVDSVHRFVGRMRGSDPDAVDDLVQTTFLNAFQSAAKFRGGHVRGWLLGIAANVVKGFARSEIRRKRALHLVSELPRSEPHRRDPVLAARLPEALAELPHDLRAAIVLIDLEGERGTDAAAALNVPLGTLWRRVFVARRRLRAALGGGE